MLLGNQVLRKLNISANDVRASSTAVHSLVCVGAAGATHSIVESSESVGSWTTSYSCHQRHPGWPIGQHWLIYLSADVVTCNHQVYSQLGHMKRGVSHHPYWSYN